MIRLCDREAQLTELAGRRHASMELAIGQGPLMAMRRAKDSLGVILSVAVSQHPSPRAPKPYFLRNRA